MIKLLIALATTMFCRGAFAADEPSTSVFRTEVPQEMTIVNVGSLSLQKRLEMVANAKRSIEVEFFIYNIDQAGRIFSQALVRKAHEGVKVRVLVDYGFPVGKLDPYYASALAQEGIEVRYYNPNLSFELLKGQFRSHRKTLVVDDIEAVTGGRNIADEYFDLAADYNFIDRDVFVRGSMAKAVRESFDRFWSSDMTKAPSRVEKPEMNKYGLVEPISGNDLPVKVRFEQDLDKYNRETARAKDYLTEKDKDRSVIQSLQAMAQVSAQSVRSHTCYDSIFAADIPGITGVPIVPGNKRVLFAEIRRQLNDAQKSIHVESPYFVTTLDGMSILQDLMKKGVEMDVYTNSLNSTDAIYTTATFYPRIGFLIQSGMNVYIYKGKSPLKQPYISQEVNDARWGIHAKSAVIDEKTIMVGTFNVDPRSRNINAEMAIMCRNNPDLAREVLDSMMETRDQSVKLNKLGQPVDGTSRFEGASIPKRIAYYLMTPLSNILDFLL